MRTTLNQYNTMRRYIAIVLILYSISINAAQVTDGKIKDNSKSKTCSTLISLEGKWKFKLGEYIQGEKLVDSVQLPGTMDTNRKGTSHLVPPEDVKELTKHLCRNFIYAGKAVYESTIDVPTNWADKNVGLRLERTRETRVWVNQQYVGWQNALGTAQFYDISKQLIPGKPNVISVEVDNSNYSAGNWIFGSHMATEETTTNWNGIVGKIQLIAEDRVNIKSIKIFPSVSEKIARIKLVIGSSEKTKGTITLSVSACNDKSMNASKGIHLNFNTNDDDVFVEYDYYMGDKVKLWSEFFPELYKLKVDMSSNDGQFRSSRTVTFGMREFRVVPDGKHFAINGTVTFLRGEANCNVFPVTGYCPMDKANWIDFLQKFKSIGVNHMRFHTWCPPEAAFEAADELGMYLQPELYLFGGRGADPFITYNSYAYMKEEGERILNDYANHPSFVMLSFGNETAVKDTRKSDLYNYFKSVDSTRLYTEGTCTFHWDCESGDKFIGDYRTAMATRLGSCREQFYFENHSPATTLNYDDKLKEYTKPFIAHEIGQYEVYPDYKEIEKYKKTIFKPTNLEYFRNLLVSKNMVDQNEEFQKASRRWVSILYRESIESSLRSSKLAGYQLLGFQDFPGQETALVGLYDSFMDSKNILTPQEIRKFNSDIVLLAEIQRFTWTSEESFSAKIKIANYSPGELSGAIPYWNIKDERGSILASGNLGKTNIPSGGLTTLGEITAPLNLIVTSQKLSLEIGLSNTSYSTSYSIWVYPEQINISIPEGIHVARSLDQVAKKVLASGGKVLFFPKPETMDSIKSISPKFQVSFWSKAFHNYRKCDSYTMGLLINPEHPALKSFPTDFHSNWQWYDLVKNSRSVVLDSTSGSYKPIVQTIDHIDRSLRLGNIFEAKVNGGKLLVCTFNLPDLVATKPEARQLYHSLLDYMNCGTFNPSETFSEKFFDDLVKNTQ